MISSLKDFHLCETHATASCTLVSRYIFLKLTMDPKGVANLLVSALPVYHLAHAKEEGSSKGHSLKCKKRGGSSSPD